MSESARSGSSAQASRAADHADVHTALDGARRAARRIAGEGEHDECAGQRAHPVAEQPAEQEKDA